MTSQIKLIVIMKSLNSNLVKITELLSDGQYHDGTSIGKV